jgi:hypothetical protein
VLLSLNGYQGFFSFFLFFFFFFFFWIDNHEWFVIDPGRARLTKSVIHGAELSWQLPALNSKKLLFS